MLAIIVMLEMMTSVSIMLGTLDPQEAGSMWVHKHIASFDNNKRYRAYVSTKKLTEVPYCNNF